MNTHYVTAVNVLQKKNGLASRLFTFQVDYWYAIYMDIIFCIIQPYFSLILSL